MFLLTLIAGTLLFVVSAVFLILTFVYWKHKKYFRDRKVPFIGSSINFLKLVLGQISLPDIEKIFYDDAKSTGSPFVGFSDAFSVPSYYITDLDLIKQLLVKDFDHFVNRRRVLNEDSPEVFRKQVVNMEHEEWKGLRSKLSPTFTTGKIRKMFQIFGNSNQRLVEYLERLVGSSGGDINMCDVMGKYAMDVIASCAFGIDSKCFENPVGVMSEFEKYGQDLQFKFKPAFLFRFVLNLLAPWLAKFLRVEAFDAEPHKYFKRVILEVLKHRRATGERHEDFLQLLMDTQDGLLKHEENSKESLEVMTGGSEGEKLHNTPEKNLLFDDSVVIANCVIFITGGFDSVQAAFAWSMLQAAVEQEIQDKLAHEVCNAAKENDGKLSYDVVNQLPYLDRFVNETLRYYTPATRLERQCTKEYKIPGTHVVIEKDQVVVFPILGVHRDPKYYPNPEKFDPDRFLPEEKNKRPAFAYLPFGQGPRNCIGMRFALTEVKAMVSALLLKFRFEPCSRTCLPPKFSNTPLLKPANSEMWLKVIPRTAQ